MEIVAKNDSFSGAVKICAEHTTERYYLIKYTVHFEF